MYCVIVQPEAWDSGMEADCHVMGPYQSMEKAQEVADKIEAKHPRLSDGGDVDCGTDAYDTESRTHVCTLHKSLRHMYGIIKEQDHNLPGWQPPDTASSYEQECK